MNTRNISHIIIFVFAIAGAALAFAGCSTPAGQTAQSGQSETSKTVDSVNSANSTVNRAADTTESVSETTKRLFK